MFWKNYLKIIYRCYRIISWRFKQWYGLNKDKGSWWSFWRRRLFRSGKHPILGKVIKVTGHLTRIYRSKCSRIIQQPRAHNIRLSQRSLVKRQTTKSVSTLEKFRHNPDHRKLSPIKIGVKSIRVKQISFIERKKLAISNKVWQCATVGSSLGACVFGPHSRRLLIGRMLKQRMLRQRMLKRRMLTSPVFDAYRPVEIIIYPIYIPLIFPEIFYFLHPTVPTSKDLPSERSDSYLDNNKYNLRNFNERNQVFNHTCLINITGSCYCHEEFGIEEARKLVMRKNGAAALELFEKCEMCTACKNCIKCKDCKNCGECRNKNCRDCIECKVCIKCENCVKCKNCKDIFSKLNPDVEIPSVFEYLFDETLNFDKLTIKKEEAKKILILMQKNFVEYIHCFQKEIGLKDEEYIEDLVMDFIKNKLSITWLSCKCREAGDYLCCFTIEKILKTDNLNYFVIKKKENITKECIEAFEKLSEEFFLALKNNFLNKDDLDSHSVVTNGGIILYPETESILVIDDWNPCNKIAYHLSFENNQPDVLDSNEVAVKDSVLTNTWNNPNIGISSTVIWPND